MLRAMRHSHDNTETLNREGLLCDGTSLSESRNNERTISQMHKPEPSNEQSRTVDASSLTQRSPYAGAAGQFQTMQAILLYQHSSHSNHHSAGIHLHQPLQNLLLPNLKRHLHLRRQLTLNIRLLLLHPLLHRLRILLLKPAPPHPHVVHPRLPNPYGPPHLPRPPHKHLVARAAVTPAHGEGLLPRLAGEVGCSGDGVEERPAGEASEFPFG
jgi:hypothetical protein